MLKLKDIPLFPWVGMDAKEGATFALRKLRYLFLMELRTWQCRKVGSCPGPLSSPPPAFSLLRYEEVISGKLSLPSFFWYSPGAPVCWHSFSSEFWSLQLSLLLVRLQESLPPHRGGGLLQCEERQQGNIPDPLCIPSQWKVINLPFHIYLMPCGCALPTGWLSQSSSPYHPLCQLLPRETWTWCPSPLPPPYSWEEACHAPLCPWVWFCARGFSDECLHLELWLCLSGMM